MLSHLGGYITIGCLAAATLGFELVQTRVLSALYYNHIVYLTVTIALMGFGIAGVLVSLLNKDMKVLPGTIAKFCAYFAVSMVVCIAMASRIPVWIPDFPIIIKLICSYLLLVIPFLCSGTAIGLIFMQNGSNIFRYYCFDLLASALACAAFTFLLTPLGAGGFIWACAFLAVAAFVIQALKAQIPERRISIFVCSMALCLGMAGGSIVSNSPEHYKTLAGFLSAHPMAVVEKSLWTPITRLDVASSPADSRKIITQDADAHTPMYGPGRVAWEVYAGKTGGMPGGTLGLPYHMRLTPPDESLVIGVGGGIDIVRSHAYGSKHTTGVEINPVTVRLVTKKYADFVVWPKWRDVSVVVEEGRHFVRSHPNTYDTITMSGIDTFSALNSGAYVLSENYLYTTEAFQDYLKALKPDGMMAINRWFESVPPKESLRLASLHVEASKRLGIINPEKSIFVIATVPWATTIIKRTPFTESEILWALAMVHNTGMKVIYLPKIFEQEQQKFIEGMLAKSRDSALNRANRAYENVVNPVNDTEKQKFLDKYPYDVTPVYDDRPFFFEYHKSLDLSRLIRGAKHVRSNVQNNLYFLLIVCIMTSLAGMIVPLTVFNREGLQTKGVGWLLFYFSTLGVGFMLIEIGMMQRLSLYLGDPMRALLVVLAGLLLCAGGGAYLSGQSGWSHRKLFTCGTMGVAVAMAAWLLVVPVMVSVTHTWPYAVRVLLTLASIIPVGVLLGVPFATGLNYVSAISPRFIPWAWGINGLTSVLASILAIVLAMRVGFTVVLIIGTLTYAAGWFAIRRYQSIVTR